MLRPARACLCVSLCLASPLLGVLPGCSTSAAVEGEVAPALASREVKSVSLVGMNSPETPEEQLVRRSLVSALAKDGFVTTSGFDLESTMQIGASYDVETLDATLIPGLAGDGGSLKRTYSLSGQWQLSDETGQFAAGSYRAQREESSSSPLGREEAEMGLPSPESVLPELAEEAADQIRQAAFRHVARTEVKLKGTPLPSIVNDVNRLVAAGQIEMARGMYRDTAADPEAKPKLREAAYYNLAVLEEIDNDREAAMQLYLQAQQQDLTDKRTLEAIQRLIGQGIDATPRSAEPEPGSLED